LINPGEQFNSGHLHRQVRRFRSLEDLVYVVGGPAEQVTNIRAIGHDAALIDKLLLEVNSRHWNALNQEEQKQFVEAFTQRQLTYYGEPSSIGG
jgi:hypothetical protein